MSFRIFGIVLLIAVAGLVGNCAPIGQAPAEAEDVDSDMSQELLTLMGEFAQAWNRHDLDALMTMMTDDGVFETSGGSSVEGERVVGQEDVRSAFAAVFEKFPDAQWGGAQHVVSGDRGFSQWTFSGTMADGTRVEVNGCDLFTFREGKIAVKNSFRKDRTPAES
jgi:ketosteroid isomerase-like protein